MNGSCKRVLAERRGDGRGGNCRNDEGSMVITGGKVFAEFHARIEMTLPRPCNDEDLNFHACLL